MPDLVSALNNLFQPSVDEKAIKICLNGAWSMGRSKISCVHVPGRVYESMYEDLLALHGAKRLYEAGLLAEISLQADRTAAESQSASGDDCACPPDTDYFQELGQRINATLAHAAKTERRFKLNISPERGVFHFGMAAHTLIREKVSPISQEALLQRARYIRGLTSWPFC